MAAFFRRMSKSTVGTVVMVLFLLAIVASFALADVQSYIGGGLGQPGALTKVGNTSVTERELSSTLQRRLADVRQQNPEADYSSLADDFEPILNSLIDGRALQVFAGKNDLRISKQMIDAEIVKLPGTRGLDGRFSQAAYQGFLQQQQLTDAQVRDMLAAALTSRLLIAPSAANARLPVGVATPYASMLLEAREASVAMVPAGLCGQHPRSECGRYPGLLPAEFEPLHGSRTTGARHRPDRPGTNRRRRRQRAGDRSLLPCEPGSLCRQVVARPQPGHPPG
jgi:peptidyl-prolyl cis-trans isomerase D